MRGGSPPAVVAPQNPTVPPQHWGTGGGSGGQRPLPAHLRPDSTRRARQRARALFVASFLLPATVLYALFVLWPLGEALVYSLYRWRGVSTARQFVGLENFRRLLSDPVFWQALEHNLLLLVGAGAAILILALVLAHLLQHSGPAARLLRSVYLFPQFMSLVVVAILWMFLDNPSFGLVDGALKALGWGAYSQAWLGSPRMALLAVGIAYVWNAAGFYTMLFSAGLQTIPGEVLEAARLDGAEGLARLRQVTLPLLRPVLKIAVIYLAINTLNIFALVYLMTQGGPDRHTEVMLTYLYEQAFTDSDFGFATALAIADLVIVLLLTGLVLLTLRRDPQEGG